MNRNEVEVLVDRIERLERQNGRFKRWGIVAVACLVIAVAAAPTFKDPVRTVDRNNIGRIELMVDPKDPGRAGLQCRDQEGKIRLFIGTDGGLTVNEKYGGDGQKLSASTAIDMNGNRFSWSVQAGGYKPLTRRIP